MLQEMKMLWIYLFKILI